MHVTEPPLEPLDTARTSVPMSDAEFDTLLGSAEFQDLLGPTDGGNGAGPGTDALTEPLGSDFAWAGDKSLDAFLGDGTASPSGGTRPASADDLASGLQAPSPSSDPMRLDPTLPISDVAELANAQPPADTALNRSYASGGPPSGCATPTGISEAGARFADAALSPPDETLARASAGNGATSSQSESVEMGRGPSPGVASGAVRAWPAAGPGAVAHMGPHVTGGAGPGPPLAPHMQQQPPHLMSNGAAPGGPYKYGGYYGGGGGGGMPFGMPGSQHPAMKGSRGAGMAGGPWPMQWGPASAPMQAPQQMWPADQLGMWAQQPGAHTMQPGGGMAGGGKQFGQYGRPLGGVPQQALRAGSEVWSSSGSGQSSQSGFHHPTLLGVAGPPQAAVSRQPPQHTPQRTIQSGDMQLRAQQQAAAAPMDVQGAVAANAPQGGQHSLRSHSARAQRPRSTRRAAQRNSHDASPQLKASSAPEVQQVPASPQAAAQAADQQAAAMQQQAAVVAPPGAFYPGSAPHNAYCMPGQGVPAAAGNMFVGQPAMPSGGVASMTGLPAGGMAAGGNPAFPPVPAGPGFGGSRSQPVSPLFQQHSAPVATTTTMTPRAASKRGSASFGELGCLSPRGGSSKNRGAYSQPGTPRSEALVLEELKALIGQLDPATKATMKNSLYRISRNAAGSGTSSDAGVAAEAAAKAAKKPDSPDEVGPVDRLVADLLYKEPLQQAPNLPQQLADTARAQQQAAESHRWTQPQQPPQAA